MRVERVKRGEGLLSAITPCESKSDCENLALSSFWWNVATDVAPHDPASASAHPACCSRPSHRQDPLVPRTRQRQYINNRGQVSQMPLQLPDVTMLHAGGTGGTSGAGGSGGGTSMLGAAGGGQQQVVVDHAVPEVKDWRKRLRKRLEKAERDAFRELKDRGFELRTSVEGGHERQLSLFVAEDEVDGDLLGGAFGAPTNSGTNGTDKKTVATGAHSAFVSGFASVSRGHQKRRDSSKGALFMRGGNTGRSSSSKEQVHLTSTTARTNTNWPPTNPPLFAEPCVSPVGKLNLLLQQTMDLKQSMFQQVRETLLSQTLGRRDAMERKARHVFVPRADHDIASSTRVSEDIHHVGRTSSDEELTVGSSDHGGGGIAPASAARSSNSPRSAAPIIWGVSKSGPAEGLDRSHNGASRSRPSRSPRPLVNSTKNGLQRMRVLAERDLLKSFTHPSMPVQVGWYRELLHRLAAQEEQSPLQL